MNQDCSLHYSLTLISIFPFLKKFSGVVKGGRTMYLLHLVMEITKDVFRQEIIRQAYVIPGNVSRIAIKLSLPVAKGFIFHLDQ